jgi:simple sugar transport system permease protein
MLRLEPRAQPSTPMLLATPIFAVVLTLLAGLILFAILGVNPFDAMYAFFIQPVENWYGVAELGVKATPLILCAVGLAIAIRANIWNIGAEGQLVMGGIFGGGLGLFWSDGGGLWVLPAMFIAGAIGGALWGAIPALLKTRFNASEILTSLMLTYVAQLLLEKLIHGPWRDPQGFNFPQSKPFESYASIAPMFEGTRLGFGFIIALVVAVGGWLLLSRSFLGFQIKVIGLAAPAAGYAGFSQRRITWATMMLSGGLAGIAGVNEVAGPIGQMLPSISPGYGFTAIIVAFLGRLHPLGIVIAALLIALSYIGGDAAQMSMNLPVAVASVFQGMLLFFLLATEVLVRYRVRGRRRVVKV